MITILSLKTPSGKATDAVDTVNRNVFDRINKNEIKFVEARGIFNKVILMYELKPQFLLGIGNIEELFFVILKPRSTRYVITWHTLLRKTKTWPIRKLLFKLSEFVIAVSGCAAETVRKYFPSKKIFVVLNGVDVDFFNPNKENKEYLAKKYGINFSKPIILFVGALFERKRPDIFIEVAKRIKNANFVLVGRKDKKDFLSLAINIDNFQWIPFIDRNDISIMMASSDIFLFPSINEPCAAVIPEAMSSGLLALLSKSCGNKELVDDGIDGFLVDVGGNEIKEFTEHLRNLLDNAEFRKKISLESRKKCENKLNWLITSDNYKKIFLENL